MTNRPFPKFHELMRPMLEAVGDAELHTLRQMMGSSDISQEQLPETIPSKYQADCRSFVQKLLNT